ncbi:VTT domain-containing protein [Nocardioides daphniae]|uniref:VTT domain-containing protein n=1 Tax=Nocardioides daphniae TaxID=402297 RepID=A0A4P7U8M1_9ACTN|nr:VTT domain-containing protein [Nocardioides daphniae]QCC76492.1 hypothetical protein E2C04_03355 [Nocardioides daphniae]GGD06185.1 hypothetical protein GCM10007231_01140 [Nocardioides daphniae]
MLVLSTLLCAAVSALFPVVNAEVYVASIAVTSGSSVWLALAAAVGQMVGKSIWYLAGLGGTRIPWIATKLARPKWQARLEKWHARTDGRPVATMMLFFVSALTGFPPFAVLSVLAGVLRLRLWVFLVAGTAGRFLRFWAVASSGDLLVQVALSH